MAKQKAINNLLADGIAYVAAFFALLLWPSRQSVDQSLVLVAGLVLLGVGGAAIDWIVFGWRPKFERPTFDLLAFITQTRPRTPSPPRRYSFPTFFVFFGWFLVANWLRATGTPDWGLMAYAVAGPLIIASATWSNVWLAKAAKPGSGDIPAR